MKYEVPLNVHGTPVAMMGSDGEWTEIGYVTDFALSIHQEEFMEAPFRPYREIDMCIDVFGKPGITDFFVKLMQAREDVERNAIDGNGE